MSSHWRLAAAVWEHLFLAAIRAGEMEGDLRRRSDRSQRGL